MFGGVSGLGLAIVFGGVLHRVCMCVLCDVLGLAIGLSLGIVGDFLGRVLSLGHVFASVVSFVCFVLFVDLASVLLFDFTRD